METRHLEAFSDEIEKVSLSVGLLKRYAAGRAAQGVGSARMLGKQLAKAPAGATSRSLKGGAQHALAQTRDSGMMAQRMRQSHKAFAAPRERVVQGYNRAVANPTATRQMGGPKLQVAADQGATGMTGVARPYSKQHLQSVAGPAHAEHPAFAQQFGPAPAAPVPTSSGVREKATRVSRPSATQNTAVSRSSVGATRVTRPSAIRRTA